MEVYDWWGGANSPPEHLKTRRQLSELGLAPVEAVGKIPTDRYDLLLYDPSNPKSVRAKRKITEKQLAALERGRLRSKFKRELRKWQYHCGEFEVDRIIQVEWAQEVLRNSDRWCILDTETTGLDADAQLIEIAVISLTGEILVNTLVHPTGAFEISPKALAVHGITADRLSDAPCFHSVYPVLKEKLGDRKIMAYGAEIDIQTVECGCRLAGLPSLNMNKRTTCLMVSYSTWYGEWSVYYKDYKWQALNGGHRALSDCNAARNRLVEMSEDSTELRYPQHLVALSKQVGVTL